jgi:hypothetical protein
MNLSRTIIIVLFALIPAAAHTLTLILPSADSAARIPVPVFKLQKSQTSGIVQVDKMSLQRSIQHMSGVAFIRRLGNSLRLHFHHELSWVLVGHGKPTMLFGSNELWVARGRTLENDSAATSMTEQISIKRDQLEQKGWHLILLPVPSKLSIYRHYLSWPNDGDNPYVSNPLPSDRTDELADFMFASLKARGISALDLRLTFRDWISHQNESRFLYPPGESHWSGDGIRLAASLTADYLADHFALRRWQGGFSYFSYRNPNDLANALDVIPSLAGSFKQLLFYQDELIVNRFNTPIGSTQISPGALIVVAGTSYSGQYWSTIAPYRGDYPWVLQLHLEGVEVQNRASAGRGSYEGFEVFLKEADSIAAEFEKRNNLRESDYKRIIIWEFPFRDLLGMRYRIK